MTDLLPEGMAALGRLRLPVREATLSLRDRGAEPIEWTLEAETARLQDDDDEWQLYFYGHGVPIDGARLPLRAGDVYTPPTENERGEHQFTLYTGAHQAAYDVRIAVLHVEAAQVRLRVSGKCDVGWSQEFATAVPFEIHADFQLEPPRPDPWLRVHQ
ncbi:MAG: hypothetical protein HS104_03135 [Polyangiaceae bacterium]|nr:hypothetical protein [Polyangiaceae bacterium]